jgi:hypothetical protein
VGTAGAAHHYDGSKWSPVSVGSTLNLWAVFGGSGHLWIVGDSGTTLRNP